MIKLSRNGIGKYKVNKDVFIKEDDISFYLLGAYCTDGNINDKKHHLHFNISSKDKDWLIDIKNIICPDKPIYKQKTHYALNVSDIDSMNWLISYGCTPRKSKTIEIEKEIPKIYHRDFVRGVVDGDGCITSSKYIKKQKYEYTKLIVYICSASEKFLKQIAEMIPNNINYSFSKQTQNSFIKGRPVIATCPNYRIVFNDSNAKKLIEWIYYKDHRLSLSRKYNKAKEFIAPQI